MRELEDFMQINSKYVIKYLVQNEAAAWSKVFIKKSVSLAASNYIQRDLISSEFQKFMHTLTIESARFVSVDII